MLSDTPLAGQETLLPDAAYERDSSGRLPGKGDITKPSQIPLAAIPATSDPGKVTAGKSNYQRRAKPPYSYIALIAMAIQDSATQKLTLGEINDYLMKKFPFFTGEYTGWRNSVRHNLSLNECFQKVLRDPGRPWGKDNYWTLNESSDYTFADGVFRRRRKRLQKKHQNKGKNSHSAATGAPRGGSGPAAGYMTMMDSFNPEHKHDSPIKQRQSSFLIDDLLAEERSTSECENAVTLAAASKTEVAVILNQLPATDHLDRNQRVSSSSTAARRQRRRDRSRCEHPIPKPASSSPSAVNRSISKRCPAIKTTSSSPPAARQTHSSSPVSNSSRSSVLSSPSSSSSGSLKSTDINRSSGRVNSDDQSQHDGCEKLWRKYEPLGAKRDGLPPAVLFQPYPFGSGWSAGSYLATSTHHHYQSPVITAQPFPRTTTYPFSAHTLAANLYPFLSTQQALQMSALVHTNDLSQQWTAAAALMQQQQQAAAVGGWTSSQFSTPLKPYS